MTRLPTLAIVFILVGCGPSIHYRDLAQRHGLEDQVVRGHLFSHLVIAKPGRPSDRLHVYIEGDGRPWRTPTRIALDPTPHAPMMLKMMLSDDAPGIYLGRPCYFGQSQAPCAPVWWTHRRYAEEVVASMAAVIAKFAPHHERVALLGHSGGGTLAMLLAEREPRVRAVVTLAGNLDIHAWAEYHDYSPLKGSLDPASRPPFDPAIVQAHYLGKHDETIRAEWTEAFVSHQDRAVLVLLDDVGHKKGWDRHWRRILEQLNKELEAQSSSEEKAP